MEENDVYKPGFEYVATFDKKGALGMWSKKCVRATGLKFCVADSEGAAATIAFDMTQVIQAENGDPLYLTVRGEKETVALRSDQRDLVDQWYNLLRSALEFAGKVKPRNPGLPPVDPRYGIKFIEIPVEYRFRFITLESAVLYWFQLTRKFGQKSRITGKYGEESRVVVVGDKAVYVTKPDSEVTRCMKISMMTALYTNTTSHSPNEDPFMVVKMESPDYDLYFQAPQMDEFIKCVQAIYRSVKKGIDLPVHAVTNPDDGAVQLNLVRPQGFQMAMVVPTTKGPLKKALDDFAKKNGIQLTSTGSATKAGAKGSGAAAATGGGAAAASAPAAAGASSGAAGGDASDPLYQFLKQCGVPHTYAKLKKMHVDLDVLRAMEEDDYSNFGLNKDEARAIRSALDDEGAPAGGPAAPAPAKAAERGGGFDDFDDDLGGPAPAKPAASAAPVSFDDLDLDDDLDIGLSHTSSVAKFSKNISLDSDDDLDLPPPKPKPKPAAVDLDDI